MQPLIDMQAEFVNDTLSNRQPVQLLQDWRVMKNLAAGNTGSGHQSRISVLYPLQLVIQLFCCTSKESIAVVQTTDDESQNSQFAGLNTDEATNLCNPAKMVVAGPDNC